MVVGALLEAAPARRRRDLALRRGLVLLLPSAVARPYGQNALINPAHEAFSRVEVIDEAPLLWDPRLL